MAQEDSKNLKKYFENDPPSFFDELVNNGEQRSCLKTWETDNFWFVDPQKTIISKVSPEVRDLWRYPAKGNTYFPLVPRVSVELLVSLTCSPFASPLKFKYFRMTQ